MRHEILDAALLLALSAKLRDRAALDAAVREAVATARADATTAERGPAIERELTAVTARIARLVESITLGGAIPELVARLTTEKARQTSPVPDQARRAVGGAALDSLSWRRRLQTRAAQLSRALARKLSEPRQRLRDLLGTDSISTRATRSMNRRCRRSFAPPWH